MDVQSANNIQTAYNTWSSTYDVDVNLTRDLDQQVTQETLFGSRYRSVIELGCGTGKNTLFLSQIADQVYAIDFSAFMLEKAKEKVTLANVSFALGDLTQRWNYEEQSADLITCNLVLEHIDDLSFIFSEAARVLVSGGRFFISELHPFRQYRGTKANFQRDDSTTEIHAFVHHISDFIKAAKTHHFILEDLQEWWHERDQDKPPRLISFLWRSP
ncbi:class I SAM-dependent methyltransferase [Oscillatoria sp. FACHB-1407]|uniref:class I SAM-dependent methyltransferase n=1 Tax=Oscillatoria sp. FACHB-1407 TaxID=2692847 RepID=UPI001685CE4C|nr:class I SAM-dependent methyltransferase [Oscillatoria sp. FACHB-1407]MBD2464565.1 class I SAM-dependent methyltransferase [Oscillatoria sp. FACHB-1407]